MKTKTICCKLVWDQANEVPSGQIPLQFGRQLLASRQGIMTPNFIYFTRAFSEDMHAHKVFRFL